MSVNDMKEKVCIIGGGVIGLCSAYYLNKAGFEVTVIDQSSMDSGASYVNAGYISPSHIIPLSAPGMPARGLKYMFDSTSPFYMKPRLDTGLMRWSWLFWKSATQKHVERSAPVLKHFNEKSKELYMALKRDERIEFGLKDSGLLMLCQTEEKLAEEKETGEFASKQGLKVELIDKRGIKRFEPRVTPSAIGAIYYKADALLIPQAFMHNIFKVLERNGVIVYDKTTGLKIHTMDGRPGSVTTEKGDLQFDKLLIAAGSWSPSVLKKLGVSLPVQAGKGYSFEINNPGIRYPAILCEANTAVTPMGKKVRFGGTMELAGMDESISMKRVKTIKENAEKYYPGISIDEGVLETAVQGLRPVSPDGMPYIGKLKQYENVFVATGHAMMGMSLGPATGLLVSQLIKEEKPFLDISLFDPNRFA
jgi:D-amino-acid dehydrogenase